ncbi:MAG: alpha/beta hydrolase family protein [Gemmataceae bacterium]
MRHVLTLFFALILISSLSADPLPGTKPLTTEGDLAVQMVAGIDKYLTKQTAAAVEKRQQFWKLDYSSPEAYTKSVRPNRQRLQQIIGVVDERLPPKMELVATTEQSALVAETDSYKVFAVRWPVFAGVDGEGLLLEPKGKIVAHVVAIPDADWTPEMLTGLMPGLPSESQYARRLAENGCRVIVPTLIDRQATWSGNPKIGRMTNQPHREFIYRMSYEMGRHVIGYETQKVLAAVNWFTLKNEQLPIKVIGYREGGLLAFYSGALDDRIRVTSVNAYFAPRENLWQEPIYRNQWGLLREFGDAEVAAYLWPHGLSRNERLAQRWLQIEDNKWLPIDGPPSPQPGRAGAAPGKIVYPGLEAVNQEFARIQKLAGVHRASLLRVRAHQDPLFQIPNSLEHFLNPDGNWDNLVPDQGVPKKSHPFPNPAERQRRQFEQLVNHTQKLMRDAEAVRQDFFWSKVDMSSMANYQKSIEPLRQYFHEEIIGKLPDPTMPLNPRTRVYCETDKWTAYEVLLDVYPDVFAHGILCVPKDLKPGERRPVVVCQHGLEGRPQDVVHPQEKTRAYNSFGSQLADLGYIVYAPQNPYIGRDDFRQLQRKANPLKLSLFSFIIRQHERTLAWLGGLPFVARDQIALYGLSYGGKTAMRVPAILPGYCLSICSGDFNEWIWKNVSIDFPGSYMFTGEYEMFEFNLGHTFNYAEMAALIAPRPFMVERGHDDRVGIDEWIAYEYAKVRRHYAKLKIPERTEIEFFDGGHVIHGQGTFAFLRKHLGWPK